VASSEKQDAKTSPFKYADKITMMTKLGVPAGRIQKVANPYQATEITDAISDEEKANTVLIFAVSAKDAQRFDPARKDGSPSYLQPLPANAKKLRPMTQQGYIEITPTVDFQIQGQPANSASQIRKLYAAGNDNDRNQIIADLYGQTDAELRDIFDQALATNTPQEGIIYGQERIFVGDNPVKVMRESRLDSLRENIEYLQQRLQQLRDGMDYIDEKWSKKYKRSINCARPRGFSQRAHCQGRKKK
jgi:hypothetical protein